MIDKLINDLISKSPAQLIEIVKPIMENVKSKIILEPQQSWIDDAQIVKLEIRIKELEDKLALLEAKLERQI